MILRVKIMSDVVPSFSLDGSQSYVNVPLGFKFKPSDEELLDGYLTPKNKSPSNKNKNKNKSLGIRINIEDRDVYGIQPWNLNWEQETYLEDKARYYFVKSKKSTTGKGVSRKSVKGYYWKNTSRKKLICNGKAWKTILRFEAEAGSLEEFQKGWVIHEYRLQESTVETDWVLCRVKNEKKKLTLPEIRQLNEINDHLMNKEHHIVSYHDNYTRFSEIFEEFHHALIVN